MSNQKKVKYASLYGVRAIACIGIVFMHVLTNGNYNINSSLSFIITNFTNFVFLFMTISSFSMCCGYYEKIKNNEISIDYFYTRRFQKILPFFFFLVLVEVLFNHTLNSFIEGFADMTFMFGYLNYDIQVVGVAWFIGLIFLFYFIFPFFVYLFYNKKRAWITSIIALFMNISCIYYFDVGRTNLFYSFMYFCIGGLIYLYKDSIIKIFNKSRVVSLLLFCLFLTIFFIPFDNRYIFGIQIILFNFFFLSYAISFNKSLLNNKVTHFIGNFSFEIYLSHMFMYRFLEKLHLTNVITNSYLQYLIICILVLLGAIVFSKIFQICFDKVKRKVVRNENIDCQ